MFHRYVEFTVDETEPNANPTSNPGAVNAEYTMFCTSTAPGPAGIASKI